MDNRVARMWDWCSSSRSIAAHLLLSFSSSNCFCWIWRPLLAREDMLMLQLALCVQGKQSHSPPPAPIDTTSCLTSPTVPLHHPHQQQHHCASTGHNLKHTSRCRFCTVDANYDQYDLRPVITSSVLAVTENCPWGLKSIFAHPVQIFAVLRLLVCVSDQWPVSGSSQPPVFKRE